MDKSLVGKIEEVQLSSKRCQSVGSIRVSNVEPRKLIKIFSFVSAIPSVALLIFARRVLEAFLSLPVFFSM